MKLTPLAWTLVLSTATFLSLQSVAATLVVPNIGATTPGNVNLGTPFIPGAGTIQMQYDESQFSGMPVGSLITALSFRADDASLTAQPVVGGTYSDYRIVLARAANTSLGAAFAGNMLDPHIVRSGPLVFPAGALSGGSVPNAFAFPLAFDTPYEYEGGDLVVYIVHNARGGSNVAVDGVSGTALGLGTTFFGRAAASFEATTGTGPLSWPIQLEFTSVPEPAGYGVVAAIGLISFGAWRRRWFRP